MAMTAYRLERRGGEVCECEVGSGVRAAGQSGDSHLCQHEFLLELHCGRNKAANGVPLLAADDQGVPAMYCCASGSVCNISGTVTQKRPICGPGKRCKPPCETSPMMGLH